MTDDLPALAEISNFARFDMSVLDKVSVHGYTCGDVVGKDMPMTESYLQRLKELRHEETSLLATAKKEALARGAEVIAELRELGFNYRLVEEGTSATPRRRGAAKSTGKGVPSGSPCPVCNFKTEPPHDARTHRRQGDRKRPFTPKQLAELELTKVE